MEEEKQGVMVVAQNPIAIGMVQGFGEWVQGVVG